MRTDEFVGEHCPTCPAELAPNGACPYCDLGAPRPATNDEE